MMNYAVNRLLERKMIFADFVNGALFGGKDMLHPEKMELLSPNSGSVYVDEKGHNRVIERRGDIRMKAEEELYSLTMITEPQASVHYAMPVRVMEYVVMEYRKQIQDLEKKNKEKNSLITKDEFISGIRKEDKVVPVIAIVLYCNTDKEWDGSRCLYEMLDWDENLEETHLLKRYLPDFQLNIVQVSNLENVEVFKTALQYIFAMLKYSKDKNRLYEYMQEHRQELEHMDRVETTAALALLGQSKQVENMLADGKEDRKGEINVCIAIEEMIKDGEMKGMERGITNMNQLVQKLMSVGRIDDFLRSTNDYEYQKQLFEEFGIS